MLDIPISESGALGAPSSVLSGARPVAIDVRASLTADLAADVVVADASGALRLLVASPSRAVDQRSGAANVAARDGLLVWSQRVGSQRYRLSGRANRLGDLRGQRVTWFDGNETFGYVRVSALHGRPRAVTTWTADDGGAFGLGPLSERYVYWLATRFRTTGSTLRRASLSARASSCQELAAEATFADPGRDLGWRPVAVDGTEIVYADARGVFATAPQELRWRPCG